MVAVLYWILPPLALRRRGEENPHSPDPARIDKPAGKMETKTRPARQTRFGHVRGFPHQSISSPSPSIPLPAVFQMPLTVDTIAPTSSAAIATHATTPRITPRDVPTDPQERDQDGRQQKDDDDGSHISVTGARRAAATLPRQCRCVGSLPGSPRAFPFAGP